MARLRFSARWVVCLALLALTRAAMAGLIVENDGSDLCKNNLRECTSRCAPPQNFLFMCNSGGTFNKPYSDCKCTTPPPVGVVTDGSGIFQMVQWPGPDACQGSTWLYDCAQYLNLQSAMNNMQGAATDQASAMAAIAAAQAAAQAQAAAMAAAQAAAAAAPAGAAPAGAGAPAGIPGMDPSVSAIPGLGGAAPATAGMGVGMGGAAPMGAGAPMAPMIGGSGIAGAGMIGAGASPMGAAPMGGAPMGAGPAMPGNSLMGNSMTGAGAFGHRHLLQGGVLGAGGMAGAGPAALPTTTLSPVCTKPIQGIVTGSNQGLMVIPNFKGVATMNTRGNDTLIITLGGQGSQCVGAYKLMSGQIMDIGRPVNAPAPAAAKSAAGMAAAASWLCTLLLAASLLLLQL